MTVTAEEEAASWAAAAKTTPSLRLRAIADRLSGATCTVIITDDDRFTKIGLIKEIQQIADQIDHPLQLNEYQHATGRNHAHTSAEQEDNDEQHSELNWPHEVRQRGGALT